jgi:hypothetical protein
MDEKSREILKKVERGELTPAEGAALMAAAARELPLERRPAADQDGYPALPEGTGTGQKDQPPTESNTSSSFSSEPEVLEDFSGLGERWRNWWIYPLSAGAGIFVLGAIVMAWGNYSQHLFWLYCGIIPLLLGFGVMFLAYWSRKSRWLHVRIRSEKGDRHDRIAISMPLPTHLTGWFITTFGHLIPGLREQSEVIDAMPEIMAALDQTEDPLIVEVNDPNGDEVKVYII